MKLLLDTRLLIWSASNRKRVPPEAWMLIQDEDNELYFSAVSFWEIAIKRGLRRADFPHEPRVLRRGLLDQGYGELAVTSEHALAVEGLARLHRDPFDRMLVAQAMVEGITLLTVDARVAEYPGAVRKV